MVCTMKKRKARPSRITTTNRTVLVLSIDSGSFTH
jgi:hypothetical protein